MLGDILQMLVGYNRQIHKAINIFHAFHIRINQHFGELGNLYQLFLTFLSGNL